MKIRLAEDPAFKAYGRIITGYDFGELLEAMECTPVPEDVVYVPSVSEFEMLSVCSEIKRGLYGQMPVQIGYCNGHNRKLNAVEYHRNSEVNIAVDDLILILGKQQDIREDYTYDTSNMEAFLIPAGTAVELYATTLHYAPCHVEKKGFRCAVVLPEGTNRDMEPIEIKNPEDRLLFAVNKWLIGHEEGGLPQGAFTGLRGENLTIEEK